MQEGTSPLQSRQPYEERHMSTSKQSVSLEGGRYYGALLLALEKGQG